MNMIEVRHLEKRFGDTVVLKDLSFAVAPGEVYGLLGLNGSGKTTTINILAGLLSADAGEAWIQGEPISEKSKYALGIAPQMISIYRDLTCEENLRFFARLYNLPGPRAEARIRELIAMFRLEDYRTTEVAKLSGGWQRRVNMAVALVHQPSVLILDEPTAGLDVSARFELWELIESLKKTGVAMLLTTHLLEEAERLCSRIGILSQGRIVAEGTMDELRATVAARQLAMVETAEEERLQQAAAALGWTWCRRGDRIILWLPEEMTLQEFVQQFADIPLKSVALQEVTLEHIYLEHTGSYEVPDLTMT